MKPLHAVWTESLGPDGFPRHSIRTRKSIPATRAIFLSTAWTPGRTCRIPNAHVPCHVACTCQTPHSRPSRQASASPSRPLLDPSSPTPVPFGTVMDRIRPVFFPMSSHIRIRPFLVEGGPLGWGLITPFDCWGTPSCKEQPWDAAFPKHKWPKTCQHHTERRPADAKESLLANQPPRDSPAKQEAAERTKVRKHRKVPEPVAAPGLGQVRELAERPDRE